MFDIFGEFNTVSELNTTAKGLLEEGDLEGLKKLAEENGISMYDVEDYVSGIASPLVPSPEMAALGKIKVEREEMKPDEIMNDWVNYIEMQCNEDKVMAICVRKKGKNIRDCIAHILNWSFNHQKEIDADIKKKAGVNSGRVTMGIPGMATAKKLIREYYVGEKAS